MMSVLWREADGVDCYLWCGPSSVAIFSNAGPEGSLVKSGIVSSIQEC